MGMCPHVSTCVYIHMHSLWWQTSHWNSTATSSCPNHVSSFLSLSSLVPRTELRSQWKAEPLAPHRKGTFFPFPLASLPCWWPPDPDMQFMLVALLPCPRLCPSHCSAHCLVPPNVIVTSCLFALRLTSPSLVINYLFRLAWLLPNCLQE